MSVGSALIPSDLELVDNAGYGAFGGSIRVTDAVVSGQRPRLLDTTCDVSHHDGPGETWAVCAAD